MNVPFVDLKAQHRPLREALLAVAATACDTAGFIGGQGLAAFETEFAAFVAADHCAGVSSGTAALRLALQAMGVGPGDLVVTVPNTFIATTEAVSQTGARFAFVDVREDDCLMDPQRLRDFLERSPARPKVVIPVHLYGQCADMDAIDALAAAYGFSVLEDACQAHGAAYHGRMAGSLGRAAAFSFYPGKNLGACGEGGAVTCGDAALDSAVRMLRDHGQDRKYHHEREGTNARLDAMQAGFLRVKLPHLRAWNERRRAVAAAYDRAFAGKPALRPVRVHDGNVPSRHLYVLHTPERDALVRHLADKGIGTGLHYPVPLHLQRCYAHLGHVRGDFPNAERSADTLLSLPLFAEMTDEQAAYVIDAVLEFFGERS